MYEKYELQCYVLFRSPEALAAARNEIDRIIQDSELNDENKPTNFSKEQLDSMTVLGTSRRN